MANKLTKHTQACIELDIDGVKIVIDPGVFDKHADRIIKDATAVLVTHDHGDHYDGEAIKKVLGENESLKVYAPSTVAEDLGSFGGRVITVKPGDEFSVGSVPVQVFGTDLHAPVHPSLSVTENVCYFINDEVYHPGDSFDVPEGVHVRTLLVPTSGPWMKTGEAADFILAVKPERSVSIHDAVDTEIGHHLALEHLGASGITGIDLIQLKPGKSIDL